MFNNLAQRSNKQDYMKQMETYLRLALKAQAQARATVEALALLKNPQPYIRQANIAQGNQQVNNAATSNGTEGKAAQNAQTRTHADQPSFLPNKLLEAGHGQRRDIGAQGAAGGAHSNLEALAAVNRS